MTLSTTDRMEDIKQSLAKDLLRRILGTPCDNLGNTPFTADEQMWCFRTIKERPRWATEILSEFGV